MSSGSQPKQGLYDPQYEHDSSGVGFLGDLKGRKSHALVRDAITALVNLNHRGACGCEDNTGDGAGILLQVPHKFLRRVCGEAGIVLPEDSGDWGVGMIFLPSDKAERRYCEEALERIVAEEG